MNHSRERRRIGVCTTVAVAAHLALSYHLLDGWWWSATATCIILVSGVIAWKTSFPQRLGLCIPRRALVWAGGLFVLTFAAALLLLELMNLGRPTRFYPLTAGEYIHFVFYTLNEEIILGALPLFHICRRLRWRPLAVSLAVAFVFAAAHHVFFKWIFPERGDLTIVTLITLFWIGVLRNNLILMTGHVGFAWAIHLGWMSAMFGSGARLTEPERFNVYLGSTPVFIMTMMLAAASVAAMEWRSRGRMAV